MFRLGFASGFFVEAMEKLVTKPAAEVRVAQFPDVGRGNRCCVGEHL